MALDIAEIMEISFNILYLVTIWAFVVIMFIRRKSVDTGNKIAFRFLLAFFLLALGDTGHVGFRVIAYALGGLESNALLVGLGALSTGITVGIFYMIIADIWRVQFQKSIKNIWYIILLVAGIARLGLFFFPQNLWGSVVPPADWGLYRNIPLVIQGLGVAILILIDSIKTNNKIYRNISICIFVSYVFYIPVILFVRTIPLIGMLMIPKTVAYVVIAIIGVRAYYTKRN